MDETNTRLREARINAGFKSARAAALRHHWTPSTYASHENGQTVVPREAAKAYAKAFKVDPAWLLNVADTRKETKPKREPFLAPTVDEDSAMVPEIDIRAGASYAGGFSEEENAADATGAIVTRDVVRTNWGIPTPFLRSELHISPGRANIVPVRGDSMKDALFDGDRAIVNLDDTDVSQGGIFALLDDNASLIIKQVEIVRGSRSRKIRCTSRNSVYTPFDLELAHPVRIVGRVAGKITRL